MSTAARAQLLPSGTEVAVEKCFPVDDAPARSADCISWGPHNVLQVCTRWAVSLYLANLLAPACQRSVRHHPLTHRSDEESVEVVVGAKWSTALLPEVYYPATARLCVQTTSNLVVYRVSRHGLNRVEMSHGIGIACFRGRPACPPGHRDGAVAEARRTESPLSYSPAIGRSFIKKRNADAAKASAKMTSKAKVKPTAKKNPTASRGKRRRQGRRTINNGGSDEESGSVSSSSSAVRSNTSSSNNSSSDTNSSSGSQPAVSRSAPRSRISATDAGKGRSSYKRATPTLARARKPDQPPVASDVKKEETASAENDDVGAVLDYTWLEQDDLLVLTTKGLHLVGLSGNLSDNDEPVICSLPPALYSWGGDDEVKQLGFRGPAPLCMAPLFTDGLDSATATATTLARLRRIVVIASPYLLRVVHVTRLSPANSATVVHLTQMVEVPSLTSVPTSVCAVAVRRTGQTAAQAEQPPPGPEVDVVVFVSAPGAVLRGRFALTAPPSFFDAASPSPCRHVEFRAEAQYDSDALTSEVCLRRLMVVPFVAVAKVAGADVGGESDGISSPSTGFGNAAVAVLGIGEKSVHAFLTSGPSSTALLLCPLLAGCSEMPPHRCAAIAGVALHMSATLAVAAVQTGQANHEPTHLWPVSVDTRGGWLRRLGELGALVADEVADKLHEGSASGGVVAPHDPSRNTVHTILQRQTSTSFFLYEQLLPGCVAQSSEVHRYAQAHQQARQPPSAETLRDYRRSMMPGSGEYVLRPSLADMPARRRYLQLRRQYGVDLFLRWPLQSSSVAGDAVGGVSSVLVSPASMEAMQASWLWWQLLQHIWANCPWDRPVLSELVLSNAVRVLAKGYGYANMKLEGLESLRDHAVTVTESARCSTTPDALDVDGAIAYVGAYIKAQKMALRTSKGRTQAASSSGPRLITVADCAETWGQGGGNERSSPTTSSDSTRPSLQVHWCVSPSWVSSLETFLEVTAYSHRRNAGASSFAGSETSETSPPYLFPCSLCDRPACAPLLLSLSSTSTHVPGSENAAVMSDTSGTAPAPHTTLFSGTTLSPLSLFSEDYVLTRCLACGLSDFADGPRCRVCGGLLE
ncbi:hypothetical protein LSCM4_00569 [Leishmania orientalis]|uniref:Uncharacterized protein n=1 Tax=Leishmania orientalis TaxID=2249476 RepID=A0A836FLX9_9TRYP|nr:hypothetical protein LSCM4_00569 [Leishmania orientalis]